MLSYFDDESLSIIDIRNKIILSHFDFAISILRRYRSMNESLDNGDSSAINLLKKYVYQFSESEDILADEKFILDNLDQ